MAKSVTATLVGILVRQHQLDVDAAGAILEWRGSDDPRGGISVEHLLRMTSGLAIREDQTGVDPNSRMLFLEPDGAGFWINDAPEGRRCRAIPMRRPASSINASSSCRHSGWWWCAWALPREIDPTWNGWRLA